MGSDIPMPESQGVVDVDLEKFIGLVGEQILRVNVLLMVNAILMGVMVGIGAYSNRYRHHPLMRFFFMGATVLFLPIVSYILSITGSEPGVNVDYADSMCVALSHEFLVLQWTGLVQIIGISTTAIVAADDREAGRSIAPPAGLVVQAVWITYLGINIIITPGRSESRLQQILDSQILLYSIPFALMFTKIFLKYYAWYCARQSYSFGRNPRLIAGNKMEQLPADDRQHVPPPLIVSREDTMSVGKDPHGYCIMSSSSSSSSSSRWGALGRLCTANNKRGRVVTMDKVWELDGPLLKSTAQLKYVCFSFALFKMLRCRFARCIVSEAAGFIRAGDFLWHVLLEDSDGTRTLGVIATELSFLRDYYYSPLPITYSKDWLPISSIFISLLTIAYCILLFAAGLSTYGSESGQITCLVNTDLQSNVVVTLGNLLFAVVPMLLVDALVILSEAREIVSYACSDWTKVALMCRYVSWREYPNLRKLLGLVLQRRCKLVRTWQDDMKQCSIIELHPSTFSKVVALLRRIIPLPELKKKVKVPKEVKAAIVETLRSSSNGDALRNGKMSLQQLGIQVGESSIQARGCRGTSDTLLAWHIATTIFEASNPPSSPASSSSASVAIHLSRYCAYLTRYCPDLLPDHGAWSSSLYKATKKDTERALRKAVPKATPEEEYKQLVRLLSGPGSKHEVPQEGARLGEQLVELMKREGEATAWKALAGFWCEMILHMAPCDNLDAHALALARGGELITLLWALLTHLSIPHHHDGCFA